MQNVELLRAIGNCLACQVWHACRGLPTTILARGVLTRICGVGAGTRRAMRAGAGRAQVELGAGQVGHGIRNSSCG